MHRFFCPHLQLSCSGLLELLQPEEIHHLKNVLRLRVDDPLVLFDGTGKEALGHILLMKESAVQIKIGEINEILPGKSTRIILACAIPKKSKFETIIEKCTELGVDEIIPLITQRSIVRLTPEQARHKAKRYQTVAINAAKQCGRTTVPLIRPPSNLPAVIKECAHPHLCLIASLSVGRKKILEELSRVPHPSSVVFFIGPEGDFTKQEEELARKSGLIPVSLGPRVLKVETAAICAVAAAQLFFHDDANPKST